MSGEYTTTVTRVDTEALHWLREFIVQLNKQDNRATATPYYYQIRKPVRTYGFACTHSDYWVWMHEDGYEVNSSGIYEMVQQLIAENIPEFEEVLKEHSINPDKPISNEDAELLSEWLDIEKVYYKDTYKLEGCFFTEKAAKRHIQENQHNLPEGTDTYLQHAYRNPEIQTLLESIGKVVGVPYERK